MSEDDLMRLFGLDDEDEGADGEAADVLDTSATRGPAFANANAVKIDEWTERRGEELMADRCYVRTDAVALADFHAIAFDPAPELEPGCSDPRKHQFVTELMNTAEYASLRTATYLDEAASALAALRIGDRFEALRRDDENAARRAHDAGEPEDPMGDEIRLMGAVGAAVADAADEVEEFHNMQDGFGMGRGGRGGGHDVNRTTDMYKRIRQSVSLRRILEIAGSFRMVARSRQRNKTAHGMTDVVGIATGSRLADLIPSELASLVMEETEYDALRRIAEHAAMTYIRSDDVPQGMGPIVVAVDESGSMGGEKGYTAKAMALAMFWLARKQGRWCSLIAFSGNTGHRMLTLKPGQDDEAALMAWLEEFLGGGSDMDVPVREMPEFFARVGAPKGKTDLLFLTDAHVAVGQDVKDTFMKWKASVNCRLHTIVIGGAEPGDLEWISDECHRVPRLDANCEAVGHVLAI